MALVLAIEPDLRQGAILKRIVREKVKAEVVIVDSRDAAMDAIRAGVPDVVLLSALLSPRDEDELVSYLRTLEGAEHLQTHTIPQLASSFSDGEGGGRGRGLLKAFRRKKSAEPIVAGCDPELFADEIRMFLEQAEHRKKELIEEKRYAAARMRSAAEATAGAASGAAAEAGTPSNSAASWDSPFEWRRSPSPAYEAESAVDEAQGEASSFAEPPADPPRHESLLAPEPMAAEESQDVAPILSGPAAEVMTDAHVEAQQDAETVPWSATAADEPAKEAPLAPEPAQADWFVPNVSYEIREDAQTVVPDTFAVVTEAPASDVTLEPSAPAFAASESDVALEVQSAADADLPSDAPVIDLGELRVDSVVDEFRTAVEDELARRQGVHTPAAVEHRASTRPAHLGPLSAWARVDQRNPLPYEPAGQATPDLIARLAIPGHVAGVAYGSGVRIRRVRVPASRERRKPAPRLSGAVILSRKALEQHRSVTR